MRVGTTRSLARDEWFDRAAVATRAAFATAAIAPHGQTVRVTTTIPAGVKGVLDMVSLHSLRFTAAGAVASHGILFGYNGLALLPLRMLDNAVGARIVAAVGEGGFLQAADVLQIDTFDGSTGGTIVYEGGYKWTQYTI